MQIMIYLFLSLGACVSCFAALSWIHYELRGKLRITLLAGIFSMACHLLSAYFLKGLDITLALFLFGLPVCLLYPHFPVPDLAAVVSIACACYGTIYGMTSFFFSLETISPFFRGALEVLGILCVCAFLYYLYPRFPGENWTRSFLENDSSREKRTLFAFLAGLAAFALCLGLPVLFPAVPRVFLPLELFAFGAGLSFFNLLLAHRQESQSLRSEQQYREEMQEFMSVIRSQRHDYNFHVQTIYGLLAKKDYAACEAYLKELLDDSSAMNRLLPLADPAVSALILSFQTQAAQSGIRLELSIENDLSQIAANVYETNKIIGNLLQNALDETRLLADRSYGIHLSILKRGEFCVIHVSNRARSESPMNEYQVGHSSKQGHEGIGIASIRHLALRYGGTVYSRMEQDIIHFVAKIPLNLAKENTA